MLTISSGHSADYLTGAVAAGRENYYTGATAAGEPPGRWAGAGAEALGLSGEVGTQDMTALYERFLDPRDPNFRRPDQWDGAATLGHTGRRYLTEDQIYATALAAEPGADAERRAQLRVEAATKARKNVAFHDATFSVQKSVTVLQAAFEAQEVQARRTAEQAAVDRDTAIAAGDTEAVDRYAYRYAQARDAEAAWSAHRQAVEDAIWAGNNTALAYLSEHAGYSRIGHHGGAAGRYLDAHDWTIASFFQHDNRNHDPQLHIHNAILNRVAGADGQWRTLDGRSLYRYRGAAAAVGERTTEEHLSRALGVRFATRPDGKAREIVGIGQAVLDLFSTRRRAITAKTAHLVAVFEARFGRAPNGLELDRLQRRAMFATRSAKSHHGETAEQRQDRWDRELRAEVAGGLAAVAHDVLDLAAEPIEPATWREVDVIEAALADVQAKKAAWTAADLTRAISDTLPDRLGDLDGAQLTALLDGLTGKALTLAVPLETARPGEDQLPTALRLADGRSAYDAPGGQRYATPTHLRNERLLGTGSANQQSVGCVSRGDANAFIAGLSAAGVELGVDQAAAVRGVLSSGAPVESLVGPAGTGKSFVVGAVAKAWTDRDVWVGQQRRAFGLASSQIATEVLTGEGLDALNVARWFAVQQRLAEGSTHPEHVRWRLAAGDLVVLDESSMTATADLARIHQLTEAVGAKLLLTGDHRQLAAVGAAGGMELAQARAPRYELAEARRYRQEWERTASLRLRAADPAVLEEYHRHGRIIDGGTIEQAEAAAIRGYLADTLTGRRSLLIVDTNEQAARVSAQIRAELVHLGRVDEAGVPLGRDGTTAGVGDIIQARRNAWNLTTSPDGSAQRAPINRRQYQVVDTHDDGGLAVAPILGAGPDGPVLGETIALPAGYVAEDVTLGYAATVHAIEGLTVDAGHAVVTPGTDLRALYVELGRGRDTNLAYVVTRSAHAEAETGETHQAVHRDPRAVLAGILAEDRDDSSDTSALALATASAEQAASTRTPGELFADAAELATTGRTARWLDELTAVGVLSDAERVALAADDADTSLARVLRRAELAGHDPRAVLENAITARSLDGARQPADVLHARIADSVDLDPIGDTYADWIPAGIDQDCRTYLGSLATAADTRRRDLATDLAANPPQWAMESLGPVPDDKVRRDEWHERAAVVAAHRELAGHEDLAEALGPPPKPGQAEAYASWRAAWRALGRPEADRAELEMTDGQLRVRVHAYEREQTWAPRYVGNELAGTRQAADQHRRTAVLRTAEADAAAVGKADQLRAEAAEAAALAAALDQQAAQLAQVDDARAHWLAHTACTRAAADRAKAELSARRAADGRDDGPAVTAEEWLAAHQAEQADSDRHRPIVDEHDLADVTSARDADHAAAERVPHRDSPETGAADLREVATDEPTAHENEDQVRVPTAEETADAVARAQRALVEIEDRDQVDEQHTEDDARAADLAQRHADDASREQATAAQEAPGPSLDRAGAME